VSADVALGHFGSISQGSREFRYSFYRVENCDRGNFELRTNPWRCRFLVDLRTTRAVREITLGANSIPKRMKNGLRSKIGVDRDRN